MRIGDLLDELRDALPGCELCAFVDLDVELTLSFSADRKPRQEQLDALAGLASRMLRAHSANVPTLADLAESPHVTIWAPNKTVFMQRSAVDPGEGTICLCGPVADAKSTTSGADVFLKMIGDLV